MRNDTWRIVAASSLLLGASGFSSMALAVDARLVEEDRTVAGTSVDNTATVNYQVGGADQEAIDSSPEGNIVAGAGNGFSTSFIVDRRLSVLVVADETPVDVPAGYVSGTAGVDAPNVAYALKYTITNQSNATIDIALSAFDDADGDLDDTFTDDLVTTNFRYFNDDGGTVGVFDATDTEILTTIYLDAVEPDAAGSRVVFVIADTEAPSAAGAVAGDYGNVTLAAQIHEHKAGTNPSDVGFSTVDGALGALAVETDVTAGETHTETNTASTFAVEMDTIFVDVDQAVTDPDGLGGGTPVAETTIGGGVAGTTDAARDGQHADTAHFIIVGTVIRVAKTSVVLNDPFNGNTNPVRIPGAEIQYTITITNEGLLDATGVTVQDAIPTNTTYKIDSVIIDGVAIPDTDAKVTYVTTPAPELTVSAGLVEQDDNAAGGPDVVTITFIVTID